MGGWRGYEALTCENTGKLGLLTLYDDEHNKLEEVSLEHIHKMKFLHSILSMKGFKKANVDKQRKYKPKESKAYDNRLKGPPEL